MALVSLLLQQLEELLSHFPSGKLGEAAQYTVLAGGKLLRPRLAIATAEMYNVPLEHTLQPACALELVHAYSLIHDDLPCMDNDDFRRGKPSLHKAYPEGHALLTGDFLLTYAFQVLAESPHLSAEQKLSLIHTLALRAGANGMIGGQELDLSSTSQEISWQSLQRIHIQKTAALITAALEFGAILASSPDLATLRQIGEQIGLAFQLLDDLQDTNDLSQQRPSAITLLGPTQTALHAHNLTQSALSLLATLPCATAPLKTLIQEILIPSSSTL